METDGRGKLNQVQLLIHLYLIDFYISNNIKLLQKMRKKTCKGNTVLTILNILLGRQGRGYSGAGCHKIPHRVCSSVAHPVCRYQTFTVRVGRVLNTQQCSSVAHPVCRYQLFTVLTGRIFYRIVNIINDVLMAFINVNKCQHDVKLPKSFTNSV